jgi:hypothetical protein
VDPQKVGNTFFSEVVKKVRKHLLKQVVEHCEEFQKHGESLAEETAKPSHDWN